MTNTCETDAIPISINFTLCEELISKSYTDTEHRVNINIHAGQQISMRADLSL